MFLPWGPEGSQSAPDLCDMHNFTGKVHRTYMVRGFANINILSSILSFVEAPRNAAPKQFHSISNAYYTVLPVRVNLKIIIPTDIDPDIYHMKFQGQELATL